MTNTNKVINHSWIPMGQGKGGEFSNSTPWDSNSDVFQSVTNVAIESNSWVNRPAEVTPSQFTGGGFTQWLSPSVANVSYTYNSLATGNFWLGGASIVPYGSVFASGFSQSGLGIVNLIDPFSSNARLLRQTSNTNKWVFRMVKNRMYCCNGADRPMIVNDPRYALVFTYPSARCYPWGREAPVAAMGYSITANAITTGSLNPVTNGSTAVVGVGTAFLTAAVGQIIFILGVGYTIAAITDNTHLTLAGGPNGDGTYAGATGTVANGSWQINTGALSWVAGAGYIYSYSYYDSITGHTSNMAPLTYVNDGPPNNGGVSVTLTNIVEPLNAANTGPDPRFTKTIIWRSAAGGGVLFPLAVHNNTGTSPFTYTDNQGDDTALGTVGPGFFAGPTTTNTPPPSDLNFVSYWQGRFWGFSNTQPGLLFFSARVDASQAEIPCGVAEESWPLVNTIPIPDIDGIGTGTRVVGSALHVLTTRGIYVVAGTTPQNYQLLRITAKGNGTSHFATCMLPGEDSNSTDVLVHVGNDSRIYFLFGAGGDVSYSYPIQDQLGFAQGTPSSNFIVDVLHNDRGTYLLVANFGSGYVHAYDIERRLWFAWSIGYPNLGGLGTYAMCEGLLGANLYFFVATKTGIYALKTHPTANECFSTPSLITQRFSPEGVPRQSSKQQTAVYLYDLLTNQWSVFSQGDARAPEALTRQVDTTKQTILSEPNEIYFSKTATGNLVQGRTFTMTFTCPANTVFKLGKIYSEWVQMSSPEEIANG